MKLSIAFYQQMGFACVPYEDGTQFAFLTMDGLSLHLGLSNSPEFVFNPCGVYFYVEAVNVFFNNTVAAGVRCLHTPRDMPWGLREFAVSDPDETLLRFGQRIAGS